ncbi:MAG: hypothetical protein Q4G71_14380 [Pseudomonadota bacterium]|nr:hypothetical protein [Pseudomonadota bacterium]
MRLPSPFSFPVSARVRSLAALLALPLLAAACALPTGGGAGASPADETVRVFKPRGAVQCGARGESPEAMRQGLQQAGVRVTGAHCGTDGLMRAAVCGGATGEINLFDIPRADLPRAEALGFAPLSGLRADPVSPPQEVPCR